VVTEIYHCHLSLSTTWRKHVQLKSNHTLKNSSSSKKRPETALSVTSKILVRKTWQRNVCLTSKPLYHQQNAAGTLYICYHILSNSCPSGVVIPIFTFSIIRSYGYKLIAICVALSVDKLLKKVASSENVEALISIGMVNLLN